MTFDHTQGALKSDSVDVPPELIRRVQAIAPAAHVSSSPPNHASFHLRSRDTDVVEQVLRLLDEDGQTYGVVSYDIQGTSIEDIFLTLMNEAATTSDTKQADEETVASSVEMPSISPILRLSNGRRRSSWQHALTIFHKRVLVARRSWLSPVLLVLIAIAGACVPLFFIAGRPQSCTISFENATSLSLYLPNSPINFFALSKADEVLVSPPGITDDLPNIGFVLRRNVTDNATFVSTIQDDFLNLARGGISVNTATGESLVAWEATPPGSCASLWSTILLNHRFDLQD